MAKLTNVKTVDMVNSEITKVAYGGAEYAKVDGEAQVGDIVVHKEGKRGGFNVTAGGYYEVVGLDRAGDIYIIENNGSRGAHWRNYFNMFRKISADKPTLEQRVDALESDVAALKGEKKSANTFKIGDTIKVVRNTASWGKKDRAGYHVGGQGVVKVGTIGKVVSVTGDFATVKFAYGDVNGGWQGKRELRFDEIELADETIEFEGATYRKVEREAREGDVIISTVEHSSMVNVGKPYKVNDRLRVIAENDYTPSVYSAGRNLKNVDVYEPIEYVPQEGDIVVITATGTHDFNIGDIVKIDEVVSHGSNPYRGKFADKRTPFANYLYEREFRKATPAEVEQYEQAVKDANKPKLKAGDYVKFKHGIHDTKADKPYLIEYYEDEKELAFKDDAGDWCSIDRTGEYEILSAEEAKWSQIGRKPNEFKKGDVVRVIDNMCTTAISIGDLAIVNYQVKETGSLDVSVPSGGTRYVRGELIAPVESLFNNA